MSGLFEGAPDQLDIRLRRREPVELPADALVAFERINRGKSPAPNYRWVLLEDGSLRLARHSGDTSDPDQPFDTPLPREPNAVLDDDQVAAVRDALAEAEVDSHPTYLTDPGVEDGAFSIVTVPAAGSSRELVYDGASSPLVEGLRRVAEQWVDSADDADGDDEDW